uniref:Retrotransposon protein, putative, Ty1-copia subclass n=1 Tax=Tanacetum cinerariifolium TaxID=118510 RepID=A0A6L2LYK6_TANCI|nr:retrotransposon protein, putative, Ty1-copia subclass [Tanacetum cinerariifolium]
MVLRVEKKLFVIEQPIFPTPPTDFKQFENVSPYEMLQEFKSMFEKQAGVEWFDTIQTFHAYKQEEGKPVGPYVIKMKNNVAQLEPTSLPLRMNLLKHKHKVFETFKVFKNKVENKLEKIIKALQSDQGGKYISQEFKDYLKACGIVQQLTPPYTPQHNGVSERRNYTLLDMVRSIMNLTTLPLSFWDYALESAARILNMVPTKRAGELEEIQDEDTSPSEITSEIPMEVEDNQVWRLVDLPPNGKTVGSKWLFNKKTKMDGNVHTYKARLVAKGFTQTYRVYYEETFSSVTDIKAIRFLIAIAAFYDYEIWKMDVKTAFLNGYLDEDIYMVQPEGFIDPKHPRKVCKLQRSTYGLKQASRSWNKRFDEEIKRFGFTQNLNEPCVYQKASERNTTFLILYVDDIILIGNHIPCLQSVKAYLRKCFAMKDLGEAAFILGIKIYSDRARNPKAELRVDCYCNAGFETDRDEIKSQT